jgi:hypothetical protein
MTEIKHGDQVSGSSCTDLPGTRFGTYVGTGIYANHPTIAEIRDHVDGDPWFVARHSLRHDAAPPAPPPTPAYGDVVRVIWGLGTVRGRVLEVRGGMNADGTRRLPRVLVEIDPGEVTEDAATLSVPLDQVRQS